MKQYLLVFLSIFFFQCSALKDNLSSAAKNLLATHLENTKETEEVCAILKDPITIEEDLDISSLSKKNVLKGNILQEQKFLELQKVYREDNKRFSDAAFHELLPEIKDKNEEANTKAQDNLLKLEKIFSFGISSDITKFTAALQKGDVASANEILSNIKQRIQKGFQFRISFSKLLLTSVVLTSREADKILEIYTLRAANQISKIPFLGETLAPSLHIVLRRYVAEFFATLIEKTLVEVIREKWVSLYLDFTKESCLVYKKQEITDSEVGFRIVRKVILGFRKDHAELYKKAEKDIFSELKNTFSDINCKECSIDPDIPFSVFPPAKDADRQQSIINLKKSFDNCDLKDSKNCSLEILNTYLGLTIFGEKEGGILAAKSESIYKQFNRIEELATDKGLPLASENISELIQSKSAEILNSIKSFRECKEKVEKLREEREGILKNIIKALNTTYLSSAEKITPPIYDCNDQSEQFVSLKLPTRFRNSRTSEFIKMELLFPKSTLCSITPMEFNILSEGIFEPTRYNVERTRLQPIEIVLRELQDILKSNDMIVIGHTDSSPLQADILMNQNGDGKILNIPTGKNESAKYIKSNLHLSEMRSLAVKTYLAEKFPELNSNNRIQNYGVGETGQIKCPQTMSSSDCLNRNRRIRILLLGGSSKFDDSCR